jgi:hypothetical protein
VSQSLRPVCRHRGANRVAGPTTLVSFRLRGATTRTFLSESRSKDDNVDVGHTRFLRGIVRSHAIISWKDCGAGAVARSPNLVTATAGSLFTRKTATWVRRRRPATFGSACSRFGAGPSP